MSGNWLHWCMNYCADSNFEWLCGRYPKCYNCTMYYLQIAGLLIKFINGHIQSRIPLCGMQRSDELSNTDNNWTFNPKHANSPSYPPNPWNLITRSIYELNVLTQTWFIITFLAFGKPCCEWIGPMLKITLHLQLFMTKFINSCEISIIYQTSHLSLVIDDWWISWEIALRRRSLDFTND